MMKKNCFNFKKAMTAAMMLLSVSMTMTSCQEFWDDLFGPNDTPTETPTEPEDDGSVTLTSTGATIKVEKVSDITELLNQIKSDIASKVGQEYVVEIISEGLKATSDDNTISVPKVEKSNINLTFANGITTEAPLVVKAAETASTTSTEAVNTLTITMPETTGLSLELNMPETGTTLNAASGSVVYNEVVATIATTESYISNGITVKELQVKDGIVTIKDGGKAETYVHAPTVNEYALCVLSDGQEQGYSYFITENSSESGVGVSHVQSENNDRHIYSFNSLKILKGTADYALVEIFHRAYAVDKLILAEGSTMKVNGGGVPGAKVIEAEGTGAELVFRDYMPTIAPADEYGGKYIELSGTLRAVESIKNVAISVEPATEEGKKGLAEGERILYTIFEVPGNMENCTLSFNSVRLRKDAATTGTISGCNFIKPDERCTSHQITITPPSQTAEIPSYKLSFKDCTFYEGMITYASIWDYDYVYDENGNEILYKYYYYYDSENIYHEVESIDEIPEGVDYYGPITSSRKTDVTYSDYNVTLVFENCKVGETALTSPLGFVAEHWELSNPLPAGVNLYVEINGTTFTEHYE